MFDIDRIKQHDFHGSVITDVKLWTDNNITIDGEFPETETKARYFYIRFSKPRESDSGERTKSRIGATLVDLDISEREGVYSVSLKFDDESIDFTCENIYSSFMRYWGMSYRNMYGTEEYNRVVERQKYVLSEEYLVERENHALPEGYVLETAVYSDTERGASLVKCALKRGDTVVYEWISNYSHAREFTEFFTHSNGRKYYPFHTDLYGISFLDLESLRAYNYIPEGLQHDYEYPLGESFIVLDFHYDRSTDLMACGGCYWAGTSDVMVGRLTDPSPEPGWCRAGNPMSFDLHLVGIHDIVDPDWELYDDIDFAEWRGDKLVVTADKNLIEVDISEIVARE